MTSLRLLLWIVFGITLQLGTLLGVAFWRHWREFMALKTGLVAAAGAPAWSEPLVVQQPVHESWVGFRPFRVVRKVIEDQAESIRSFYLEPEDGQPLPSFFPGQFLTFRLEIPAATGGLEPIVRCYSLSDAPTQDSYRISIKRVTASPASPWPPGRSSNHLHDHIEVGDLLQVRAPAGHFHIDRGNAPVVLVAGGIGITPLLSMLNWSLAEQPGRELWLFYGMRNSRELIMKAHLEALAAAHPNFHLRLCFSQPLPDDQVGRDYQHQGRVDITLFRQELRLKPYHFYVCGPAPMMETLIPALEVWGVPTARIHFETFGPASIKRQPRDSQSASDAEDEENARGIMVNFAKSGRQLAWQSGTHSLLEFAEANGISINSGCRAGGCGSCQTRIESGAVSYRQAPDFDPDPGTCLLCVCIPKTSVTLEA
ncbi:MAG: 2Fe-2S iron-sulfur cluster binding domain-containing protein [Chromatiaceae bacterium]|nr:2Fe-2S iron-sulfur cluster binding domain-containing protein [Chromatiaceae bacterium]MBP6808195.1 2Fe-2S iron-sulfur cluster binding domain-containing protein [Chromatiaceae bacterium]MBP8288839.1 2Fe-2S iron-sulfur cluster binding domain-containing protein [Chromatiaceae bacterium]MBP9603335.1 2Fe-2S iron-sulfur cluster binding domain-containing protein [Chromatiaceae bacterium]